MNKVLPYNVNVCDEKIGLFPDEFVGNLVQPYLDGGVGFTIYDSSAGVHSPQSRLGTPLYWGGYVVECQYIDGKPVIGWQTAQQYLDQHGIAADGVSAECAAVQKLMWESVSVREQQVVIAMSQDQWLYMHTTDGVSIDFGKHFARGVRQLERSFYARKDSYENP